MPETWVCDSELRAVEPGRGCAGILREASRCSRVATRLFGVLMPWQVKWQSPTLPVTANQLGFLAPGHPEPEPGKDPPAQQLPDKLVPDPRVGQWRVRTSRQDVRS